MTREMADKPKRKTALPFSHTSVEPACVPVFIDLEQYFPEPTPDSESFLTEQTATSPVWESEISQRLNRTSQKSSLPLIATVSDPCSNDLVVTLTREQRTISVSSGESFYTNKEQNAGRKSAKRRHHSDANPGFVDGSHVNYKRAKMNYSNQTAVPSRSQQFKSYETTFPVFTLETLTMEITRECSKSVQSTETLQKKLKLKSFLENLLSSFLPGCSLHLCGSSSSGFGNESSDADFCLILHHLRQTSNRREALMVLRQIYKVLLTDRYSFLGELQVIPASVPILKFKDMISGCECDINVNNVVGVRNTHLLRGYSGVDFRVKPLVMLVKKWAKKHDINDASQGTLSSYALTLMVIHYLQAVCKPAVVPVLQLKYPTVFQQHGDVQNLLSQDPCNHIACNKSENRLTLGELLLGFFKYYAEDFRWSEEYFNIKKGVTLPRNPNHYKRKHIVIEEPFDGNNVAKSVCSLEEFNRIKLKFRLAWHTLRISPSLESIKVI